MKNSGTEYYRRDIDDIVKFAKGVIILLFPGMMRTQVCIVRARPQTQSCHSFRSKSNQ